MERDGGADVEEHGGKEAPTLALHDMPVGFHAKVKEDLQIGGAIPYAVFQQPIDEGGSEDEEVDGDERAADARGTRGMKKMAPAAGRRRDRCLDGTRCQRGSLRPSYRFKGDQSTRHFSA